MIVKRPTNVLIKLTYCKVLCIIITDCTYIKVCPLQEEAIDAFVQPEILEDTNQYFCEKCNKKCDAHKVIKNKKYNSASNIIYIQYPTLYIGGMWCKHFYL